MKKTTGYSINFAENTITLTKAFAQRAKNPSTNEFRELAKLHKNFPELTITMRTAVITADKETHGGLTIEWMTDYIKNYKDEVAVAEFEEAKKFYKKMPGYYGKVKAWFLKNYPNYQDVDFADTIIVLEVSRLARSTQQLCEIIERVREKRLRLVIVGSITLDCREGKADPMSEAFLQMAGVFSQLELSMIRARVRSGMANAKAKGKQIGRPQVSKEDIPAAFLRHYPAHKNGQLNISELARVCDISRTTAYKYKVLLEE